MQNSTTPGLIFLSHASEDKDFVGKVLSLIPQSHVFYDTKSVNPGKHTMDELDDGLLIADVFVIFVSPITTKKCWVDYEIGVAHVQKVKRKYIRIIVCPIKGATYEDAPEWMRDYMVVPHSYTVSDIARCIKYAYEEVLMARDIIPEKPFVGREALANKIIVESRSKPAETGIPVNFFVLAGIYNMGRFTLYKHIMRKIFPGSRSDIPVFELPRYADAVDVFLALRQDITGSRDQDWISQQIQHFPADPEEQAQLICNNFMHFAEVNQTIVIKSAYGLRDQGRPLKPWVEHLFKILQILPNLRVVWISERLLPGEIVLDFPNVLQFHVPELDDDSTAYLLSELLDVTDSSPSAISKLATFVHGHPASAYYVATLIKSAQRSPESLIEKSETIRTFQEKCLLEALKPEHIGDLGVEILQTLKLLPSADFGVIRETFDDYPAADIADSLNYMVDNCLVSYNMSSGYRIAKMVRSFPIGTDTLSATRLTKLAATLSGLLKNKNTSLYTVEAMLFVHVRLNGFVPDELKDVVTGAVLHDLVDQYYTLGLKFEGDWSNYFRMAAKLAVLADNMQMSADTRETILFNGADSLIRLGEYPEDIIARMNRWKFPSVNYLLGSYYYHAKKDHDNSILYLEAALKAKSYTKRTGRLLAKVYLEQGNPRRSLGVFSAIGDGKVNRDTGLLAQKIRCLRAAGEFAEANRLVSELSILDDDLGEYYVLSAARLMRKGRYDEALGEVQKAGMKPKVNRINLKLLETAIKIEKGEDIDLEPTCKLAVAVGLSNGAASLRARAALRRHNWQLAEVELSKIDPMNYYDKVLLLRMLHLKKSDALVSGDPMILREVKQKYESLLVELKRTEDDDWFDYGE